MKILLVEDDAGIGRVVTKGLEAEGFEVDWLRVGLGAADRLKSVAYKVVILDLMLPDIDGTLLSRQIRLSGPLGRAVPIMMLTARDGLEDKLEGFRSGADDYLTKPFHFEELLARVRAHARRESPLDASVAASPDPRDPSVVTRVQSAGGPLEVSFSAREVDILRELSNGKTMSELADAFGVSYKTIANVCASLRVRMGARTPIEMVASAIERKLI